MGKILPQEFLKAIASMKSNVFMFPRFKNAYDQICQAIELYRTVGIAENHLVLGSSGCGKSTLCKLIVSTNKGRREPERNVVPILYMEIPALATISALVEGLLNILGDPGPRAGTITEKTGRLGCLAKGCGVLLIILDEMQHVHDRGKILTISKVADWIKSLTNIVGCPIMLVGLPRTQHLVNANEQLRRRFSATLSLERFDLDEGAEADVNEFAGVVVSFLDSMPLRCALRPDASADDLRKFYYATDGRVGYLASLLARALLLAHKNDLCVIDDTVLEQAFKVEIWYEGVAENNPFSKNFCGRMLNSYGEPFYEPPIARKISAPSVIASL